MFNMHKIKPYKTTWKDEHIDLQQIQDEETQWTLSNLWKADDKKIKELLMNVK